MVGAPVWKEEGAQNAGGPPQTAGMASLLNVAWSSPQGPRLLLHRLDGERGSLCAAVLHEESPHVGAAVLRSPQCRAEA